MLWLLTVKKHFVVSVKRLEAQAEESVVVFWANSGFMPTAKEPLTPRATLYMLAPLDLNLQAMIWSVAEGEIFCVMVQTVGESEKGSAAGKGSR